MQTIRNNIFSLIEEAKEEQALKLQKNESPAEKLVYALSANDKLEPDTQSEINCNNSACHSKIKHEQTKTLFNIRQSFSYGTIVTKETYANIEEYWQLVKTKIYPTFSLKLEDGSHLQVKAGVVQK